MSEIEMSIVVCVQTTMSGGRVMEIDTAEKITDSSKPITIFHDENIRFDDARPVRSKFNISMEKKIERLWLDAKDQGWSFSNFVSVVLEVLTVLHHRDRCFIPEKSGAKRAAGTTAKHQFAECAGE
jgi:hypothetical protein